jgi:anaerobic ribonucleoside-triphosphate reductase activating protein
MSYLNIAHFIECTSVEGPGKRFALWCQGCVRRCAGCCNIHLQALEARQIVDVRTMFEYIHKAVRQYSIEGVTFLGGEPFLQARGLYELACLCRKAGLTVMAFSGYTLEELRMSGLSYARRLLKRIDLLLDGPYIKEQSENKRNWAGSQNQRFHYLTSAYDASIEHRAENDGLEIRIEPGGKIRINGNPLLSQELSLLIQGDFLLD